MKKRFFKRQPEENNEQERKKKKKKKKRRRRDDGDESEKTRNLKRLNTGNIFRQAVNVMKNWAFLSQWTKNRRKENRSVFPASF